MEESGRPQLEKWIGKRFHDGEKPPSEIEELRQRVLRIERALIGSSSSAATGGSRDAPSVEKIEELVNSLLSDPTSNLGIIPDFLERKLDRRIILLLLSVINKALNGAAVKIGDHTLSFSLVPQEEPAVTEERPPVSAVNMDAIIFAALKSVLSSAKADFLGHTLLFHLD